MSDARDPAATWRSAAAVVALAAGCASPPPDQTDRLPIAVPAQYAAIEAAATADESVEGWSADLGDPRLQMLVVESLAHNQDLRTAAARLEAAEATARIAGADRFPQVRGEFGASRTKRNTSTGFSLASTRNDQFSLTGNLAWELDVWGRILNETRAAVADYQAASADYRGARLSLAVNTARAWFNAVEAEMQLQLARDSLQSFERNLKVVEDGFGKGVQRALDVRLTRANVAGARGTRELRNRQRDGTGRALEVLLGRYPKNDIALADTLPAPIGAVPAGLPSDLLRRRPDLVTAERRLAAADQRFRAARKNLLPTISLTSSGGATSADLTDLLDPKQRIWALAGNVTQPLFQGGRLKARRDLAEANRTAALAQFAQTALQAFREVETALASESYLAAQESALRSSVDESTLAEDLAWQEYQKGLTDIITVLESQRRSVTARSSLLQIVNQRLQNRLDLYLALGGDFGEAATP